MHDTDVIIYTYIFHIRLFHSLLHPYAGSCFTWHTRCTTPWNSKCYDVLRCKDSVTLELRSTAEFFCFWDLKYSLAHARKPPRLGYMRYRIRYRGLVYPIIVIQLKAAVVQYDLPIPQIYATTLCDTVNPNICSPYRVTFHSPPKLYTFRIRDVFRLLITANSKVYLYVILYCRR